MNGNFWLIIAEYYGGVREVVNIVFDEEKVIPTCRVAFNAEAEVQIMEIIVETWFVEDGTSFYCDAESFNEESLMIGEGI